MRPAPTLLLILALLSTGCGEPDALDRTDGKAVARATIEAMAAGDFEALKGLMTPDCYKRLHEEIAIFQTNLTRPDLGRGKEVHRIGRMKLGADWAAAAADAAAGGARAAYGLILRLQPFPDPPELLPEVRREGQTLRVQYRRAGNVVDQVDLLRQGDTWSVARIGF